MTNKTLIKTIVNVTSEGVSFELTEKAQINKGGISTNQWYVSWDKIGEALFRDQYSHETSVKELKIERNKTASKGIRYCDLHGGHGFITDCIECNIK